MVAFYGEEQFLSRISLSANPISIPHSGVVLIDEAENHLHPALQQQLGFWLKRHFPNVQFIVTTHSPFICQAADPGGLLRCVDGRIEPVPESLYTTIVNGSSDEAAVTEMFGLPHAHSPRAEKLREDVARLEVKVRRGLASEAEIAEYKRLRAALPSTPLAAMDQALRGTR